MSGKRRITPTRTLSSVLKKSLSIRATQLVGFASERDDGVEPDVTRRLSEAVVRLHRRVRTI
jgi:hypothetical protein